MQSLAPLISKPIKNVRAKDLQIGDYIVCANKTKLRITNLTNTENRVVAQIDYKNEIDFNPYSVIDNVERLTRE